MASLSKSNEPPTVDELLAMLNDMLGNDEVELWKAAEEELKYQGFNVIEFRRKIFSVSVRSKSYF